MPLMLISPLRHWWCRFITLSSFADIYAIELLLITIHTAFELMNIDYWLRHYAYWLCRCHGWLVDDAWHCADDAEYSPPLMPILLAGLLSRFLRLIFSRHDISLMFSRLSIFWCRRRCLLATIDWGYFHTAAYGYDTDTPLLSPDFAPGLRFISGLIAMPGFSCWWLWCSNCHRFGIDINIDVPITLIFS